jgi:hypothetical protein
MTTADMIAKRILDQAVAAGELERKPEREGITDVAELAPSEIAFVLGRIPPAAVAADRDAIFAAISGHLVAAVAAELRAQAQAHAEHADAGAW